MDSHHSPYSPYGCVEHENGVSFLPIHFTGWKGDPVDVTFELYHTSTVVVLLCHVWTSLVYHSTSGSWPVENGIKHWV